jgi:ankyrin repeat protein
MPKVLRDAIIHQLKVSPPTNPDDSAFQTLEILASSSTFRKESGMKRQDTADYFAKNVKNYRKEYERTFNGLATTIETLDDRDWGIESEKDEFQEISQQLQGDTDGYDDFIRRTLLLRTPSNYNCFHFAAYKKDVTLLKDYSELARDTPGAPTIIDASNNGWTPLHQAVVSDDVTCVEALVRLGGFNNHAAKTAQFEWTPLGLALCVASIPILTVLLSEKGVDLWERNDLHYRQTLVHLAAESVNISAEALSMFLEKDPSLASARDTRWKTPLHRAATNARLEKVQLLLKYGADPSAQDVRGCTPLHFIWSRIVHLRLKTDVAQIYASTDPTVTLENALEIRKLLIDNGSNGNLLMREGVTPSQYGFALSVGIHGAKGGSFDLRYGSGLRPWEGGRSNRPKVWTTRR